MIDYDGDGDIDEFDEEMAEFEYLMLEDEMIFEEEGKGQNQGSRRGDDRRKTCGSGVLIAIGIFVIFLIIVTLIGN